MFVQRVLANPDAFNSVEKDFLDLQETKTKIQSPQEEEQFETAIQELRTRWEQVKGKIEELHPRMQIMAENFTDYKDKLDSLAHWVQQIEQTCSVLDNVQDCSEFHPLRENFEVRFVTFCLSFLSSTLSLPEVPKSKIQDESQILFCKIFKNK